MKMKEKINSSIRLRLAISSITIMCSACLFSLFVVVSMLLTFYTGGLTIEIVCVVLVIVCTMTMGIGGMIMWHASQIITNPIVILQKGVNQISTGDFSVEIPVKGQDEISNLAMDFNKMAKELKGMEYLSKEFISNVSHEIKTPVAVISGYAEVLKEGNLEQSQEEEYLSYLYEESLRLSVLCENMMKMSRLDTQEILMDKKEFDLDEQIRKVIIFLSEKWEEKKIEYDLELDKIRIVGDYDLLFQVWTNLLDNAVKFSKYQGVIVVSCHTTLDGEKIEVRIKDQGIGIPNEKIPRIFDKFYQGEESHKKEGHGLGLSIVKRILDLHGGIITCTSKLGEGTEFFLLLKNLD